MAKVKKNEPESHDLEGILRKVIEDCGMTQNAIASLSGISAAQLSRFVRGERSLKLSTVSELAKALKFTISKL